MGAADGRGPGRVSLRQSREDQHRPAGAEHHAMNVAAADQLLKLCTWRRRRAAPRCRAGEDGFTLIEALISTALMAAILAAIATVTAQWLPNWNRGFAGVQRNELLALGLE